MTAVAGIERRRVRPARAPSLRTTIIVGLAIRYALAPFTSWEIDSYVWARTSSAGSHHLGLYARPGFTYPPLFGNVLQALGQFLNFLGLSAAHFMKLQLALEPITVHGRFSLFVSSPQFNLALKSVLFAFDLSTAWLAAALVRRLTGDETKFRLAFALFFLNPFVIFESSVMAGFDVIVGFAIVLAVYAALAERWILAGAALAFGIAAKAGPLVLLPLVGAYAVLGPDRAPLVTRLTRATPSSRGKHLSAASARLGSLLFGLIVTGVVLALPELVAGGVPQLLTAVGKHYVGTYGGFSLYGLSSFRGLEPLGLFANNHRALVHNITIGSVTVAVIGAVAAMATRGATPQKMVTACVGVLAVLLITTPLVQPQYLLWFLPLVVVLAVTFRSGRGQLLAFSFAPIVVFFFAWGPAAFLFPLAAYTSAVPVQQLVSAITSWSQNNAAGLLTARAFALPSLFMTVLVLVCDGVLVARSASSVLSRATSESRARDSLVAEQLPASDPPADADGEDDEDGRPVESAISDPAGAGAGHRRRHRWLEPGLGVASLPLAACLMLSPLVAATVGFGTPSGSVGLRSAKLASGRLSVALGLTPSAAQTEMRLAVLALRKGSVPIHRVLVFEDPSLASERVPAAVAAEVLAHLQAEFALRDPHVTVSSVNASQLRRLMSRPTGAAGTSVVDALGSLPTAVMNGPNSAVHAWLDAGGVLVWAGGPLGQHPPPAGRGQPTRSKDALAAAGMLGCVQSSCARLQPGAAEQALATPSQVASALGIEFRMAAYPLLPSSLMELHGTTLGWKSGGRTSVTALPVGRGAVVYFAAPLLQFDLSTTDLTVLLSTRAYAALSAPRATTVELNRSTSGSGDLTWSVSLPSTGAPNQRLEIVAMDPDPMGTMLGTWLLP